MVGLSVVLEGYRDISCTAATAAGTTITASTYLQIVNKASMVMKPTSPTTPSSPFSRRKSPAACGFLDCCFLCKQKLLPGKDIYMYKGEWAFCSVECRCKQILKDEEESFNTKKRDNMKSQASKSSTSSSSSPTTPSSRSRKTAARNRPNGFAY